MTVVLGFDIERSGATDEYDTIGIGASVIDENLKELDTLFLPRYFPNKTKFEKRCWDQFWSKHPSKLKKLTYKGLLNKKQREKEMINLFMNFRRKWEKYAKDNNKKYVIVSDNNVYDGGFVNKMMFDHLPGTLPLPYDTNGSYDIFWETFSIQKGFLMGVDPDFKGNWGLTKRIGELYSLPKPIKEHDHLPDNDAYHIAYDYQVLEGIRDGRFKKKEKNILFNNANDNIIEINPKKIKNSSLIESLTPIQTKKIQTHQKYNTSESIHKKNKGIFRWMYDLLLDMHKL